jgi:pilus assembly protein HofM
VESLLIDYRAESCDSGQLLVTAARQEEVAHWQDCLAQAKLFPDAIELAPCAIQQSAYSAGVPAESLLLHRMNKQWLWVAPHGLPFQFGLLEEDEIPAAGQWHETLCGLYTASKLCGDDIYYSSIEQELPPTGLCNWSPFNAFRHKSPPLPVESGAFAIAAGLALRPVER